MDIQRIPALLASILLICGCQTQSSSLPEPAPQLTIKSDTAAPKWDHGYPVGNGRLGILTLGAYPKENLYLNENSIWARQKFPIPEGAAESIQEVRRLANEGKHKEADQVWTKKLLNNFKPGSYEFAGMATVEHMDIGTPSSISNTLDLTTGLNRSVAHYPDGTLIRETIALRERDIIAVRVSTTRASGLRFKLSLTHPRDAVTVQSNHLILSGQAAGNGTRYQSHLILRPDAEGRIVQEDDGLVLKGGREAIILFTAATDYNMENPNQPLQDWHKKANGILARSTDTDWNTMTAEGQTEMRAYMDRFHLDLGATSPDIAKLTTGERIKRYRQGGQDPDLEEKLFQFGRYCLVASNRRGGLPANLQGLWSAGLKAPWSADYHLNINLQMNYWPAEPTGLSELHQPMLDLVSALQPAGKKMAKILGYDGFCCGHAVNAWKDTWFSGNKPLWGASLMNGAWITAHMMEHYRFSGDRDFLKQQAWPAVQENARFILGWLQYEEGSGKWITGPGTSPENVFRYTVSTNEVEASVSCGTTHDLMLAWESLSDLLEAADELDIDNELIQRARKVLPELAEAKIGSDGRLQEWREPHNEKFPGHRHISHAYGFFPGRQYNIIENTEVVEALTKSIDFRLANGGGHTGWSRAWLINIEACLMRPEPAYQSIRTLLSHRINPNLFDMHPPFQIDGNFGYTSGICTMLLQSHIQLDSGERVLWLLPALPEAWPDGEVHGLHTRGGAVVNLKWKPGNAEAHIEAARAGKFQIRYHDQIKHLDLKAGQSVTLEFP